MGSSPKRLQIKLKIVPAICYDSLRDVWSEKGNTVPAISVVVVSDYAPDEAKEFSYFERCLRALAAQDLEEDFEVIVVTPWPLASERVEVMEAIVPGIQIIVSENHNSFEMKNLGARAAGADIVAFIDADCFAEPQWLRSIVEPMRAHGEFDVTTGKTIYEERELLPRAFCLLSRAIMDSDGMQQTKRLSNHNCALRKSVVLAHPFPEDATPFGGTVYASLLMDAGHRFLFSPEMITVHIYDGWSGERDIRRNNGYTGIRIRQLYPSVRYAWLARLGYFAIPILFFGRLLESWRVCLRRGRDYGISWYELPYAMALAVVAFSMEIPGMITAVRRQPLSDTSYR